MEEKDDHLVAAMHCEQIILHRPPELQRAMRAFPIRPGRDGVPKEGRRSIREALPEERPELWASMDKEREYWDTRWRAFIANSPKKRRRPRSAPVAS